MKALPGGKRFPEVPSKEISADFSDLAYVVAGTNGINLGTQHIGPGDFEDADWDMDFTEEWYLFGKLMCCHPEDIYDPPRGLPMSEWRKFIHEIDFIHRHTQHPQAWTGGPMSIIRSCNHDDLIEWVLMLPDDCIQQIGLLPWTIEWIQEERQMRRIRPPTTNLMAT